MRARLMALGLGLGLATGLELVARRLAPPEDEHTFMEGSAPPVGCATDPILGWLPQPGKRWRDDHILQWEQRNSVDGGPLADEYISPEGFRDDPLGDAPAGARRILVLGDSTVWGFGVRRQDGLVERAERQLDRLNEGSPGRPVELINGGVSGFTVLQSEVLMERNLHLGLDGVVIYNLNSDAMAANGLPDSEHFDRRLARATQAVLARSGLYRLVTVGLRSIHPGPARTDLRSRVYLSDYLEALERMAETARDQGASTTFVLPPSRGHTHRGGKPASPQSRTPDQEEAFVKQAITHEDQHASVDAYQAAMVVAARRTGSMLVDGPELFRQAGAAADHDEGALFMDHVHPTPRGHGILGDAIASALAEGFQQAEGDP